MWATAHSRSFAVGSASTRCLPGGSAALRGGYARRARAARSTPHSRHLAGARKLPTGSRQDGRPPSALCDARPRCVRARPIGRDCRSAWLRSAGAGGPDRSRHRTMAGHPSAGLAPAAAELVLRAYRRLPTGLRTSSNGPPVLGSVPLRARLSGVETTVPPTVFVPTPDAETLVDMVLAALPEKSPGVVVDCGAGAGAIALGVAMARPDATVFALELSRRATRATRRNVRRSRLSNVQACRGSLLSPLPTEVHGSVQVLVANLPFYPKERYAAIGGVARSGIQGLEPDGLGLHRMLIAQAADVMAPRSSMILQMFQEQWPALTTGWRRSGSSRPARCPSVPSCWRVQCETRDSAADRRQRSAWAESHPFGPWRTPPDMDIGPADRRAGLTCPGTVQTGPCGQECGQVKCDVTAGWRRWERGHHEGADATWSSDSAGGRAPGSRHRSNGAWGSLRRRLRSDPEQG